MRSGRTITAPAPNLECTSLPLADEDDHR